MVPRDSSRKINLEAIFWAIHSVPNVLTKNISHTISVFVSYFFSICYIISQFFFSCCKQASKQRYMLSVKLILISFPIILKSSFPICTSYKHGYAKKNIFLCKEKFRMSYYIDGVTKRIYNSWKKSWKFWTV